MIDMPLDNSEVVHTRKVYGFIDLLGNYGGIKNAMLLLLGLFFRQLNADMALFWMLKKCFSVKVDSGSGK